MSERLDRWLLSRSACGRVSADDRETMRQVIGGFNGEATGEEAEWLIGAFPAELETVSS